MWGDEGGSALTDRRTSMIVLLLILWTTTPGLGYAIPLQWFETVEACQKEEARLALALGQVFPPEPRLSVECHTSIQG